MNKLFTCFLLIFFLHASSQSGITWNAGQNIATNLFGNLHPRIDHDALGNPLVIWGRASDESVFFSRWNGTMFTAPVKLNPAWLTVATASWMGPEISAYGDTVYVIVKRTPEASDTNHIYLMRSFNGGQTFSAPVRVDFIADSISRFPTVTTDATGNPIIAFMKFDAAFGASRWVVLKSADYGSTFSVDVKASGWNGASGVCDCCPGSILSKGNFTAMLYRNDMNNIRDSWIGVSNNNAASFYNGINVDNRNWMITSCPASGPDGVIVGDTIYSVFMNGATLGYRTYLSKTSINNLTVKSVAGLTGTITGLSQQNYPTIATSGNALGIVWKQTVSGSAQLPILFTNDIRKGFPLKYDTVDLADITNADITMYTGKVFVVWEDDNSGTIKFSGGAYTQSTTGIAKPEMENIFSVIPNPTSGIINIELSKTSSKIMVKNILGQELFSHQTFTENNIRLDLSEWNHGIYFITVQSGEITNTKKIIKE